MQTVVVSGTVWPNSRCKFWLGVVSPQAGEKGWS